MGLFDVFSKGGKYFGKSIEPKCEYCESGKRAKDGDKVLCSKKGLVDAGYHCPKFVYSPLKRIPEKQMSRVGFLEGDYDEKDDHDDVKSKKNDRSKPGRTIGKTVPAKETKPAPAAEPEKAPEAAKPAAEPAKAAEPVKAAAEAAVQAAAPAADAAKEAVSKAADEVKQAAEAADAAAKTAVSAVNPAAGSDLAALAAMAEAAGDYQPAAEEAPANEAAPAADKPEGGAPTLSSM